MTMVPNIDNRGAAIGQQVIAQRVFFGGDEPSQLEREGLRQRIATRFATAMQRGFVEPDEAMEIDAALRRLLGPRGGWTQRAGLRVASIDVPRDAWGELLLPLELLRPPGSAPILVRAGLAETAVVPEASRPYVEGGRIVLATDGEDGLVPDGAILDSLERACALGVHRSTGSEHDRKRGAFDPTLDHLPGFSRRRLYDALGPQGDRPGATVLQLACRVCDRGLCSYDDDGHGVAILGAEALAAMLAPFASHLRVVVLTPVAMAPWEGDPGRPIVEVAAALHQRGIAAVVAPRVPLPATALPALTSTLFGALLGHERLPPSSLEVAIAQTNAVLAAHAGFAYLGLRLYAHAAAGDDTRPIVIRPYRGLLSFGPEHARFYVGREAEIDEARRRLAELEAQGRPRLLLLVGASGVGKSSLAKAGVVPALMGDGWVPVLTRPAQHNTEQLDAWLASMTAERRLVVIDQLEEAFTESASRPIATAYLQRLWVLASTSGIAVVATLRIDALDLGGEVRIDADAGRTLEQLVPGPHAMFVHHLDSAALERVISEPAHAVGLELDPGLADHLCAEALSEPGALPMLELVLDRIWNHREGRRMVASACEGGLAATLAVQANACVDALPAAKKAQAKRILVRLATGSVVELAPWRRRSSVEALQPERRDRRAEFEAALAALVEARLVVRGDLSEARSSDGDGPGRVVMGVEAVELAHELLLRRWDALRGWIEAAAPRLAVIRDLEQWVDEWSERGTLLTPQQLTYIDQAKLSADADDLNARMLALLAASRRAARTKKLVRRAIVAGFAVAALGFAILSQWALDQRDMAQEQTRLVEEQRKLAERERVHATEQTKLAEARLGQAIELTNAIIFDTVPELERIPQARRISKTMLEQMQEMLRRLDADDDAPTQRNIAIAHITRGDEAQHTDGLDVARREYEAAEAIAVALVRAPSPPPSARVVLYMARERLGDVAKLSGDVAGTLDIFRANLELAETLAATSGHDDQASRLLAIALGRLGEIERETADLDAARGHFQRSADIFERMAAAALDDADAQHDLIAALLPLGNLDDRAGNLTSAQAIYRRCLRITEAMVSAHPDDARAQQDLATVLVSLSDTESVTSDVAAAREHLQRALALREALVAADPLSAKTRRDLAAVVEKLGELEATTGRIADGRALFQRSVEMAEAAVKADPTSAEAKQDLGGVLEKLGNMELKAGDLTTARELFQRSLEQHEALANADPRNAVLQRTLCVLLTKLGNVETQADDLVKARELLQHALHLAEPLATDSRDTVMQHHLAVTLTRLGVVETLAHNFAAARELLQRSVALREALAKLDSHDSEAQRNLALTLDGLGDLEVEDGKLAAARVLYQRAFAIREMLAKADPDDAHASFDVVLSYLRLADVADQLDETAEVRRIVAAANARIDELDAAGQIDGRAQREEMRALFRGQREPAR